MSDDAAVCGQGDASGGVCPKPPSPVDQYTVKSDDTWDSIAADHNLDPAVLMLANNIDPTNPPDRPTTGATLIIPTEHPEACVAPGPGNSNNICSDPTPPDLLTITPVSDDDLKTKQPLLNADKAASESASPLAIGVSDKPWVTVAVLGKGASVLNDELHNCAKADFANAFHKGLKFSYKELGATSRDDFWTRSGIISLAFFQARVKPSHHTLGCAVDIDCDRNPYIAVNTKQAIASEEHVASKPEWNKYFQKVFDVYARAALFVGMPDPDKVMAFSRDFRDQSVRFKQVHQALRVYLSIAYDVDLQAYRPRQLTHPLLMSQDENDGDDAPTVADVGKCPGERTATDSATRLADPASITYPWHDPKSGRSSNAAITKEGLKALLDSIGCSDKDLTKLYYRVRRDHELIRLAMPGPGATVPPTRSKTGVTTRDPCNGFMWFHPAVPIGMALAKANVRCLGFSPGVAWGSPGTESGDIMHFDFT